MKLTRILQALLLWAIVTPVDAEPATIAYIVSIYTAYQVVINLALLVVLNVYSSTTARRKARRAESAARAAYNSSLQDRSVTVLQAIPPLRLVYGRCVTGGDPVAMFTTDSTRYYDNGTPYTKPDALRHVVIVLAAHQVQAIGEVFIAGIPIGPLDGNGWVTTGAYMSTGVTRSFEVTIAAGGSHTTLGAAVATVFSAWDTVASTWQTPDQGGPNMVAGSYTLTGGGSQINNTGANPISVTYTYQYGVARVKVDKFLGTDTQTVVPYLNSVAPTQWTANHRLRGLAGIVLTLDLEEARFQGGMPQVAAEVQGKLLFDTRSSTTAWSDNNALCIRDFLTSWLGMSVPTAYVDTPLCNAAANACDVGVNVVDFSRVNNWFRFGTEADLEGWTVGGATLAVTGGNAVVNSNSTDPVFIRNNLSPTVAGTTHRAVRARIKRVAGAAWQGVCFFDNTTHGFSASFYKQINEPTYDPVTGWAEVLWDMTTLTVGGADWTTSTIRHIRLDLGNGASDNFLVDWVTVGPLTSPMYTLNGAFTTGDGKEAVLERMAESMMGAVSYGAAWLINAGAWTSPVMDLLDDDLDGQISFPQTNTPMDEVFNGVRGTFIPFLTQTPIEFDSYQNTSYVTADGAPLWTDVELPFCNSGARATNLVRIKTEEERNGQIVQYPAKLKAFPLQIGDRVRVNSAEYGLVLKTYRVTDRQFGVTSPVLLTLQHDVAASYDLINATTADAAPDTALPNPWKVAMPAGVAAASGTTHLLTQSDGTILTRVLVTWNPTTDAYIMDGQGKVRVRYRRQLIDAPGVWRTLDVPGEQLAVYLTGMLDGEVLTIGVRFSNSLNAESNEAIIFHAVVGKTQAPVNVAGLTSTIVQAGARISWSDNNEADYESTELRYGASWAAGTFLFRGNARNWTWLSPAQGTYTVRAKHYDTTGNESATDQTVSVVVDAAALVLWASIGGTGKPIQYRVTAAGYQAAPPNSVGLFNLDSGANDSGANYWTMVARFNLATGAWIDSTQFNLHSGGASAANAMQAFLDGSCTPSHLVVIWSYDQPGVYAIRTTGTLLAAMKRCGASDGVWGYDDWGGSRCYILIGVPDIGAGNGYELLSKYPGPSWCSTTFVIQNGSANISGGGSQPNIVWSTVFGTGKPADNATSDLSLVNATSSTLSIVGNTATKTGASASWSDCSFYSTRAFTGGCFVSWVVASGAQDYMIGLNADPTADLNYTSLDYAMEVFNSGTAIYAYESTTGYSLGGIAPGDQLSISYDGQFVRYAKNGTILRTVGAQPGLKLWADSSFYTPGSKALGIQFGPYGNAHQTRGANLVDASWWAPGVNPLSRWTSAQSGTGGVDEFIAALMPDGSSQVVWRSVHSTTGNAGGGWASGTDPADYFPVDPLKTYFFAVYVKRVSGTANAFLWGLDSNNTVADLNTTTFNNNPYFGSPNSHPVGKWCLAVGWVYPYNTTGHVVGKSGLYNCETGALLTAGNSFNWLSASVSACSMRAFQYYGAAGDEQRLASPQVYLCDGSEPNVDDLLSMIVPTSRIAPNAATVVASSSAASPTATMSYSSSYGGHIGELLTLSWTNNTGETVNVECSIDHGGLRTAGNGSCGLMLYAGTTAINLGGTNNSDLVSYWITVHSCVTFIRRFASFIRSVTNGQTIYVQALVAAIPNSGSPITVTGSDIALRAVVLKR